MRKRQFEKMLTPELLKKLERIAYGATRNKETAKDAVQTALLRVFRRSKKLKKITPSYLATAVIGACRNMRQRRGSNASIEFPVGLPGDKAFQAAEQGERRKTFGTWTQPRTETEIPPGPTDLWRK